MTPLPFVGREGDQETPAETVKPGVSQTVPAAQAGGE
jgi:hypothetical protein